VTQFLLFLRRSGVNIATGILSTLVAQTALSRQPPLSNHQLAWPGLTSDDVDRMYAAAARPYEGGAIGNVERWRNPDSKNAGKIKLVRSFTANGLPRRRRC
jgi:hypothetical protein